MVAETDMVTVRVNVDLPAKALQTIVQTLKTVVGPDDKGHYRVDTADQTGEIISRFLNENGFGEYVNNPKNYSV